MELDNINDGIVTKKRFIYDFFVRILLDDSNKTFSEYQKRKILLWSFTNIVTLLPIFVIQILYSIFKLELPQIDNIMSHIYKGELLWITIALMAYAVSNISYKRYCQSKDPLNEIIETRVTKDYSVQNVMIIFVILAAVSYGIIDYNNFLGSTEFSDVAIAAYSIIFYICACLVNLKNEVRSIN